jgi:alkylation response protein AidB-like acyl-CoA dehydrogenase
MGPNWVIANHVGVHIFSKGGATGTYGRCHTNYTIFEGTSEIQRLVISRAISGVLVR